MVLIKRENQYSNYKYEYEVLEREKIEEIIDNLDRYEVSRKLTEKALEYAGLSGRVFVEIDVKNGDVYYQFLMNNTGTLEPDLWITLMNFGDVQNLNDLPDDCLLYPEEIDAINKLMSEDIYGEDALDYGEAYDKVIEDNNINIGERIKDYYLDYYALDLEFNDDIQERLDTIYTND